MSDQKMSVELRCVKERNGKLRVRIAAYIDQDGKRFEQVYNQDWNCQFPRNLRQDGKCFTVPSRNVKLQTTKTGLHYYSISVRGGCNEVRAPVVMPETVYEISPECVICMDSISDLIFTPCGHLCSCAACGNRLTKCCICRQDISGRIEK